MNQPEITMPILLYFNIRGKLQGIRYLLFYMNVPFQQIHIQNEEQMKNLPQVIINLLKKERFQLSQLPTLLHQGLIINDIYPIMAYLCRRFNHVELLGRDIRQKARLQQILEITLSKMCPIISNIFKFAQKVENLKMEDTLTQKHKFFQSLCKEFPHIEDICRYFGQNDDKGKCFMLKDITIIDFCIFELFFYSNGFFGDIAKQPCMIKEAFCSLFGMKNENFPEFHMNLMKNYIKFFSDLSFYRQNKEYLQKFSIVCGKFAEGTKKGVQKLWTLDKKFVH